ncbi:hypothetical protein WKV44_04965 [Spirochaetia bacterium 38H-sp]|uniref:Uncharacterized protein n=1 Tax=Rarispira pelagica TaxID=3141764 RepID=A0ABU9UB39_9SPIR
MKKKILFTSLIIFSLLAISCAKGTTGLFYSLSIEEEITDNSDLSNDISVADMTESSSYIFINTSFSVFYRTISGTDWSELSFPSDMDICTAISVYNDGTNEYLYAAFSNDSLSDNKLYRVSATNVSSSWEEIWSSSSDRITSLFYVYDGSTTHYLFANRQSSTDHALIYSTTGAASSFTGTTAITASQTPVIGVVYDGSNFWAATRDKLFSNSTLANLGDTAVSDTALSSIEKYTAIALETSNVYVSGVDTTTSGSAENSYLAMYNGSEWQVATYESVWITSIAISGTELVAGLGKGIKTGSDINSLTEPGGNYLSTGLDDIYITELMFVGSDLYAATASNGLWKRSSSLDWSIE